MYRPRRARPMSRFASEDDRTTVDDLLSAWTCAVSPVHKASLAARIRRAGFRLPGDPVESPPEPVDSPPAPGGSAMRAAANCQPPGNSDLDAICRLKGIKAPDGAISHSGGSDFDDLDDDPDADGWQEVARLNAAEVLGLGPRNVIRR